MTALNPYGCSLDSAGASIGNNLIGAVNNSGLSLVRYQIEWNTIETAIATTSNTAVNAPGSVTITPAVMLAGFVIGNIMQCDTLGGPKFETVTITGTTGTTVTATFANTHSTGFTLTAAQTGDTPASAPTRVNAYSWTAVTSFVNAASTNGFLPVFCVQNAPTWHTTATPGSTGHTVATPADSQTFVANLLQQYPAGTFYSIEAANEGFDAGTTYTGNDLFQLAYSAIQNVKIAVMTYSPTTLIGGPATIHKNTPYFENWWTAFYANNCHKLCDYLVFHYYPHNDTSTNPGTADAPNSPSIANTDALITAINNLQKIKIANNDGWRPVWLDEIGYTLFKNPPGTNGGIIDSQYATYLLQALETVRKSGVVQHILWYDLGSLAPGSGGGQDFTKAVYQTWKQYIGTYTQWSPPATNFPTFAGRDGTLPSFSGRSGVFSSFAGRDGTFPSFSGKDGTFPSFAGRDGTFPPFVGRG